MKKNIKTAKTTREEAWLKWFDQSSIKAGLEPEWLDRDKEIRIYKRTIDDLLYSTRYVIRVYKADETWTATFEIDHPTTAEDHVSSIAAFVVAGGTTPAKAVAALFVRVRQKLMDMQVKFMK